MAALQIDRSIAFLLDESVARDYRKSLVTKGGSLLWGRKGDGVSGVREVAEPNSHIE